MLSSKDVYLGYPGLPPNKLEGLMLELRTVGPSSGLEFRFQDTHQRGKSCTQMHILKQRFKTRGFVMPYKPLKEKF
uniref:Gp30.3' protein n=2 Tax=unclassified Tequatrovirus TaxID=2562645 RepID=B7FAX7_BPLZ5|nr:gp30.3' protein [Enterobacteria phage KC69]CAJ76681.1 gp30.3' protein [Enterobacteria phage LZ5]